MPTMSANIVSRYSLQHWRSDQFESGLIRLDSTLSPYTVFSCRMVKYYKCLYKIKPAPPFDA